MGTLRLIPLAFALSVVSPTGGNAQHTDESPQVGDVSTVMLPCTPVAAYWDGPPPSSGMPPGPNLAVVSINVRPKDALVHLEDRFVGRARYLDGKPGYLYLEPGSYRLELRHGGYRTVVINLDATAACRYDLKHRMERAGGKSAGESKDTFGKGMPFDRVFAPATTVESTVKTARQAGPDANLRSDLDLPSGAGGVAGQVPRASLRLRVSPVSASVSIDGEFVATAEELRRMEGPLATTAGKHQVVVRALGFVEATKTIELDEDEVLEIEFHLAVDPTN